MKKLLVLLIMATVGMFLLASSALALPLAHDITIWDKVVSGGIGWTNRGSSDSFVSDDNEVEPNCQTGQGWDLEGFYLGDENAGTGSTLYMVAGYNYVTGMNGYDTGDLFFDVSGDIIYGESLGGSGNNTVANIWGYDYALRFDFVNMTADLYELTAATLVNVYYSQNDEANPWKIADEPENNALYLGTIGITLDTLNDGTLVDTGYASGPTGGTHYVISFDLTDIGLGGYGDEDAYWYVHYTYECGNDNLMGQYYVDDDPPFGDPVVPLPMSVVLLGSGLLGFVGLGARRKGNK